MYCTYITFYRGNKLPPFYIGQTSLDRVSRGYNGSVSSKRYNRVWNKERKEHPHLFRTVILRTFNTREEALLHEENLLWKLQAHKNELYINMNINGKIFDLSSEQLSLNGKKRWSTMSREERSLRAQTIQVNMSENSKLSRKQKLIDSWKNIKKTRVDYKEWTKNRSKKAAQSMTPEQRADRSKRAYETRRLNASLK